LSSIETRDDFDDREIERPYFALDQELAAAGLYATADRFLDLIDFVAKHWRIAPYNALLLHIQKPDLTHVETVTGWWTHYRRKPRRTARPMITLQPFSPVSLVYDLHDTQGDPVPDQDLGPHHDLEIWHDDMLADRIEGLARQAITVVVGSAKSGLGSSLASHQTNDPKRPRDFKIILPDTEFPISFRALVYQLAGIYLGHHGLDDGRGVKHGQYVESLKPFEVAYLTHMICERCGLRIRDRRDPPVYDGSYEDFDVYRLMKATGDVERLLRLPFFQVERPTYANGV
jgi:hypothetical protein